MLTAEQTNIEVVICGKCNQMQFYFCLAFHLLTCNHHSGHGHLYYFLKCFFFSFCVSSFCQGSLHRLCGPTVLVLHVFSRSQVIMPQCFPVEFNRMSYTDLPHHKPGVDIRGWGTCRAKRLVSTLAYI